MSEMTEDEKAEIRRLRARMGVYKEYVASHRAVDDILDNWDADGVGTTDKDLLIKAAHRLEHAEKAVEVMERDQGEVLPVSLQRLDKAYDHLEGFLSWLKAHGREEPPASVTKAMGLIHLVRIELGAEQR